MVDAQSQLADFLAVRGFATINHRFSQSSRVLFYDDCGPVEFRLTVNRIRWESGEPNYSSPGRVSSVDMRALAGPVYDEGSHPVHNPVMPIGPKTWELLRALDAWNADHPDGWFGDEPDDRSNVPY